MKRGNEAVERRVVVSGVGQSAIARRLPSSGFRLAIDSILAAIADAGLRPADVDGLFTFPGPSVESVPGSVGPDLYEIQDALGLRTRWHASLGQGIGLLPNHAVLAVATGMCRHAVVFRTMKEGSGRSRDGRTGKRVGVDLAGGSLAWLLPIGAVSPANWLAPYVMRHMHEYGTTREQLGWLAVTQRVHAAGNPHAIYRSLLSLDEYMAARPVSTPLCLYDCDVPIDGSTAFVLSAAETARDLRHPVRVEAIAMSLEDRPLWEQWSDLTTMASHATAAAMWSRTDLRPADVDVAELYDGFGPLALFWLEALGFCERGESGPFVEGGERIGLGGELPLNTWGGQLSGGRLHGGFGHLAEAVRQLRGEAGPRQVPGAEVAVVSSGGGWAAGCMLLTRR